MPLKGRWTEAIPLYRKAIAAEPAHILARYNLAYAYALTAAPDQALLILQEFSEVGCPACLDRLKAARKDKDFASLAGHPRFTALVGAVP